MSTVIPDEFRLPSFPECVPCLKRLTQTYATAQSPYQAGSSMKIPIETGSAGSFINPAEMFLKGTLSMKHTYLTADYQNFDKLGMNAIIKEFRVMCNGNPTEKNTAYNHCVQTWHNDKGISTEPFHQFLPNPWTPGEGLAGAKHINYIKPSMVDVHGNPMYARLTMFDSASSGNGTLAFGFNSTVPATSNNTTLGPHYGYPTGQGFMLGASMGKGTDGVSVESKDGYYQTVQQSDSSITYGYTWTPPTGVDADGSANASIINASATPWQRGLHAREVCLKMTGYRGQETAYTLDKTGADGSNLIGTGGGYIAKMRQLPFDFPQQFRDPAKIGSTLFRHTAAEWPTFQPRPTVEQLEEMNDRQTTRLGAKEEWWRRRAYWSNCREIPIGVGRSSTYNDLTYYNANASYDSTKQTTTDISFMMPLWSGLFGQFANCMFPALLIMSGKLWLEIDLEDPRRVFWFTMDPCRRVKDVRDYLPYLGNRNGLKQQFTAIADRKNTTLGVGMCEDTGETNEFVHPHLSMGTHGRFLIDGLYKYGTDNYAPLAQLVLNDDVVQGTFNINTLHLAAICHYQYSLNPTSAVNSTVTGETLTFSGASSMNINTFKNGGEATSQVAYIGGDGFSDVGKSLPYIANYCAGNDMHLYSSIPLPQWVPCSTPGTCKATRYGDGTDVATVTGGSANQPSKVTFVNERDSCFGTYLVHSRAQSRRTIYESQNNPSGYLSYTPFQATYEIRDAGLYYEEYLLPDSASESILQRAAMGGIAFNTTMMTCTRQNLPGSLNQNALFSVVGSSVRNLTFTFQSTEQINTNRSYGYNSFSYHNPFTALKYTPSISSYNVSTQGYPGVGVDPSTSDVSVAYSTTSPAQTDTRSQPIVNFDVGGTYEFTHYMQNTLDKGLQIQLKIGNDLYPRTAIQGQIPLFLETMKASEATYTSESHHTWKYNLVDDPEFTQQESQSGMMIDVFEDGFHSVFVPLKALDDQTITGNPYYAPLEHMDNVSIRGLRCPSGVNWHPTTPRYYVDNNLKSYSMIGVLNKFVPPNGCYQFKVDLQDFKQQQGVAKCGKTIIQNAVFLQGNYWPFCLHEIDGVPQIVEAKCIAVLDVKVEFQAGGNMVTYQ